jgi:hypothetical protein
MAGRNNLELQYQLQHLLVFVGIDLCVVEFTGIVFFPSYQVCVDS